MNTRIIVLPIKDAFEEIFSQAERGDAFCCYNLRKVRKVKIACGNLSLAVCSTLWVWHTLSAEGLKKILSLVRGRC